MSDKSPKPFQSNSPITEEPSSNAPITQPEDLRLEEDGEVEQDVRETSPEPKRKERKDSKGDGGTSPHANRTNASLISSSQDISGRSAKRFKPSSSDDESESTTHETKKISSSPPSETTSTASQTSEVGCATTRSAPRINRDNNLDRDPQSTPELVEFLQNPATPPSPVTPPNTLRFLPSVPESREGGEPAVMVTPDSKPVTPNNGQLIGMVMTLASPQPDVNNDAMLDNNMKPWSLEST